MLERNERDKTKLKAAYWFDDVFIDQGWCWFNEKAEVGDSHYKLVPLCLGKESEIVPILKGDKPVSEEMSPKQRAILLEILSEREKEHERATKPTLRATRLQRKRLIRSPRHIKRGFRHA